MKDYQPRRLRIVQKDMETYTGPLQGFWFTNGVSNEPIPYFQGMAIGSHIGVVDASDKDDAKRITPAAESLRLRDLKADAPSVSAFSDGSALKVNPNLAADRLTREQLEAIADKEGLAGVRDVARKWGRTGRSIKECIDAVLTAQKEDDLKRVTATLTTLRDFAATVMSPAADQIEDQVRKEQSEDEAGITPAVLVELPHVSAVAPVEDAAPATPAESAE